MYPAAIRFRFYNVISLALLLSISTSTLVGSMYGMLEKEYDGTMPPGSTGWLWESRISVNTSRYSLGESKGWGFIDAVSCHGEQQCHRCVSRGGVLLNTPMRIFACMWQAVHYYGMVVLHYLLSWCRPKTFYFWVLLAFVVCF